MHQWMGVFPTDPAQAQAVIGQGVVAASLGRATKLINKTVEEAVGLPSKEANASAIRYCKELAGLCARWPEGLVAREVIEEEGSWIAREVDEILEGVYGLVGSDLAGAVSRAFERGLLDIPFPASRFAHGRVLPARDRWGAIRYLEVGGLPFSKATRAFHRHQLGDRRRFDYRTLSADIHYLATGPNPSPALGVPSTGR
jgi:methylaspartate mutase epsilon subunit